MAGLKACATYELVVVLTAVAQAFRPAWVYSNRSAIEGSTRAARRAGT